MDIRKLTASIDKVSDPRRKWGNYRHKLEDILIIGLCSVICLGEDYEDMEIFGNERKEWLGTFLELPNGIPDSDTFRRVFERLDPAELSNWLNDWVTSERQDGGRLINVDGKTIRGSKSSNHRAYHVISAWVGETGITLGQLQVEEKSNEIKAVPELLELLDIEGDVVTADAMSCQKEIAKMIQEKKGDYILALKGNHPVMEQEVAAYFAWLDEHPKELAAEARWTSPVEKGHGRIEKREITTIPADWYEDRSLWSGIKTFVRVKSHITQNGETSISNRYYISSLDRKPEILGQMIRGHWSVENQLHWCLDVIFNEDASRARKDNSPLNLNVLRKFALYLLKNTDMNKRMSLQKKRMKAALSHPYLLRVLLKK